MSEVNLMWCMCVCQNITLVKSRHKARHTGLIAFMLGAKPPHTHTHTHTRARMYEINAINYASSLNTASISKKNCPCNVTTNSVSIPFNKS
jgi:hypothetical protein